MPTLNREVFLKDPIDTYLPNDGVAKVAEPRDAQAWRAAEFELSTFVCEGAYHEGLNRILGTFLNYLDKPTQPAAWVSGFYGSGKSHLVRVLDFLWRDTVFPSGASARTLTKLPDDIREKLQELTTIGRQEGGLWSAAGTPISGHSQSVRLAIISVLLQSARLPQDYGQARFVMWLKKQGWYDAVAASVKEEDEDFDDEILNLSISTPIARGLLKQDPALGNGEADLLSRLTSQFPIVNDISEAEMLQTIESILRLQSTKPGKLPCTLIVLDELQQYLGSDLERSTQLQLAVERCCSHFGSHILFVCTGQSALEVSTPLARLKDRFTVKVELSDTDVEAVVREVVLRKAASKEGEISAVLSHSAGEISRHLALTKLRTQQADDQVLVADYPLLPVRRRFWEHVIRVVGTGASAQLRTQLRVTLESVQEVANKPVGTVVPADKVFYQQQSSMLQTGVLLQDTHNTIARLATNGPDGPLSSRLCATIFLINRINREGGADLGIRANADTLSDLLVDDLNAGSASLRQKVPAILADLVSDGVLMQAGAEFLLQTREGQEWEKDRRLRFQKTLADTARIRGDRFTELKNAASKALDKLSFTQGVSKVPRKIELHFSADEPKADTGSVPVWIRDGWTVTDKNVRDDAQRGGVESAVVYVYLPKRSADELDRAIAEQVAAHETLISKGEALTPEAIEAKRSMESRKSTATDRIAEVIAEVLANASVFQGGGNEVSEGSLRASVDTAARNALARLFPQFSEADMAGWEAVVKRAKQGNADALSSVGYSGDVPSHPVVRQVLDHVGSAGAKGIDVRRKFTAAPYGWSQDAVDGALLVALTAGSVRALKNGVQTPASGVDQSGMGQIEFRCESVAITGAQKIGVRSLLRHVGITYKDNEEAAALPELVRRMSALADECGGQPPLPLRPAAPHLEDLSSKAGNDLILGVYQQKDKLKSEFDTWTATAATARIRRDAWTKLEALLKHASTLDGYEKIKKERDSIYSRRSLLADQDPIAPLISQLTGDLRSAVNETRQKHIDSYSGLIDMLDKDETWGKLTSSQQDQIRASRRLGPLPKLEIDTDEKLLSELSSTPLPEWETRTDALTQRVTGALHDAVKLLEPSAVHVRAETRTLKTRNEALAYLAELEERILEEIEAGNPVIVGA